MTKTLSSLIVSRMTHDLANPLGAIGNGIELLEMTDVTGPEIALLKEATQVAQARLRLFRIAFGANVPASTDLPQLLVDWHSVDKTKVTIVGDATTQQLKPLLLLLMVASSCLPRGGDVSVQSTPEKFCVSCQANRILEHPSLVKITDPLDPIEVDPNQIHFDLLAQYISDHGANARVEVDENNLKIQIKI